MTKGQAAFTLVFLGRSGSGKDTHYRLLANQYKNHLMVNTGDLFRRLARTRGLLGKKVKEILDAGDLPPGWLASFLLLRELVDKLEKDHHLFAVAAPRRIEEAELFDEVMVFMDRRKPVAIYLNVSEKEAAKRLLERGREDDTPGAIKHRLQYFKENVLPVVAYYRERKRLIEVDGELAKEVVHRKITEALRGLERK